MIRSGHFRIATEGALWGSVAANGYLRDAVIVGDDAGQFKVSGGTRSDQGRDCRDAFLGLMKTCDKLGVSFWDYLGRRLHVADAPVIAPLPNIVRQRTSPA